MLQKWFESFAAGLGCERCGRSTSRSWPGRRTAANRILKVEAGALVLGYQVEVRGVPGDVATHERTEGQDREATGPHGVECGAHQRRSQPLALEPVVDLGVVEGDALVDEVVLREP